jgi:hypothetical protein
MSQLPESALAAWFDPASGRLSEVNAVAAILTLTALSPDLFDVITVDVMRVPGLTVRGCCAVPVRIRGNLRATLIGPPLAPQLLLGRVVIYSTGSTAEGRIALPRARLEAGLHGILVRSPTGLRRDVQPVNPADDLAHLFDLARETARRALHRPSIDTDPNSDDAPAASSSPLAARRPGARP